MTSLRAAVAAVPLAFLAAAPAPIPVQDPPGQSIADLRQEIDRLRQELAKRDADLEAAKAKIKSLEDAIAVLKSAPSAPPAGAVPPAAPVPPTPADPSLGPAGLLAMMQSEYLAAFPSMPDTSSPQKLNLHLRALEGWCTRTNRDNIRQLTWVGTIDPSSVAWSGRTCSFTAVFQGATRDYRCPISVDSVVMAGLRTPAGDVTPGKYAFQVVMKPRLAVNRERPQPSAFENPPMVAPYVEMNYDLDVRTIMPATSPASGPATGTAPAGAP
jgi:hypothetical protein